MIFVSLIVGPGGVCGEVLPAAASSSSVGRTKGFSGDARADAGDPGGDLLGWVEKSWALIIFRKIKVTHR